MTQHNKPSPSSPKASPAPNVTARHVMPPSWVQRLKTLHLAWAAAVLPMFAVASTQAQWHWGLMGALGISVMPAMWGLLFWRQMDRLTVQVLMLTLWVFAAVGVTFVSAGVGSPYLMWLFGAVAAASLIPRRGAMVEALALAALGVVMVITLQMAFPQTQQLSALMSPVTVGFGVMAIMAILAAALLGRPAFQQARSLELNKAQEEIQRLQAREAELLQEKKEALAASKAKSRFLANMSHELRTPLNAIIGFTDVMKQKMFGPLHVKYAEYAELIHDSGHHLLELVGDILDMAKIEADKYTLDLDVFDARDAIEDCVKLTRRSADEAKLQLQATLPDVVVPVRADRRAIKQMVLNLISNAVKFTPEGGHILVGMTVADGDVIISVADTGVGISPEDLKRLGTPYEQAGSAASRARGTGLGLSLVQALSQLHGGHMEIHSQLGQGTTVSLRLPIKAARLPETDEEPDPGPARALLETVRVAADENLKTPPRE